MYKHEAHHSNIIVDGECHPFKEFIEREYKCKINCVAYIEPYHVRNAESDNSRWKLRQPQFQSIENINTINILNQLKRNTHPYYKKIYTRHNDLCIKIYSTEFGKNAAIKNNTKNWGNMLDILSKGKVIPEIIEWLPEFRDDVHVLIYKHVDGTALDVKYGNICKKWDTGHPDSIAGILPPYWATITAVNYKHIAKVKRQILDLFKRQYEISCNTNLSHYNYQLLDREGEWENMWRYGDDRKIINIDDWRLQNIIELQSGDCIVHKFDRIILSDYTNAFYRLKADLRNQSNIEITEDDAHIELKI